MLPEGKESIHQMRRVADVEAVERARVVMCTEWNKYRKAIIIAKRNSWVNLCGRLNDDVWRDSDEIVMKKFGRALPVVSREFMERTLSVFFPPGEGVCRCLLLRDRCF